MKRFNEINFACFALILISQHEANFSAKLRTVKHRTLDHGTLDQIILRPTKFRDFRKIRKFLGKITRVPGLDAKFCKPCLIFGIFVVTHKQNLELDGSPGVVEPN